MNNNEYWFYLEPYVHIFNDTQNILLYNTLNGADIIINKNNKKVFDIVNEVKIPENLYVTSISPNDIKNNRIANFIKEIKEKFFGDILDKNLSKGKPVQMIPILKLENKIENNIINPDVQELNSLAEITLFLNSNLKNSHRENSQFIFCTENGQSDNEIEFSILKHIIDNTKIGKINITGNNIFSFSKFDKAIQMLENKRVFSNFYMNYKNPDITHQNLKIIQKINSQINYSVSSPINNDAIKQVVEKSEKAKVSYSFDFKIETEPDTAECEKVINKFNIDNYNFLPYYNQKNTKLFEEAVYLEKDDIFEAHATQKDILARQAINQLSFGKLFILPNADVYANLNNHKIGNLKSNNILEIINKELYHGNSWRKLRKDVEPCNNCIYNLLCPSLSNYEYAIGKNNLCNIKNK